MHCLIALALTTLLAAAVIAPTTAHAGTYTVYSCRTPSGVSPSAEGWEAYVTPSDPDSDRGVVRSCRTSTLSMEFGNAQLPVQSGSALVWTFRAPRGTWIDEIAAEREFDLSWVIEDGKYAAPYAYDAWVDTSSDEPIEYFYPEWGSSVVGHGGLGTSLHWVDIGHNSLSFRLWCSDLFGAHRCAPSRAKLTLDNVRIRLHDPNPPHATALPSALRGDLGAVRGVGALRFTATDVGAGVYRAIVAVDGEEVRRSVVQSDGGRCGDVEPGNGDPYEFGGPQPCPTEVDATVALDTQGLRDGAHRIRVSVEDAAGNVALVHDGLVTTHNAPVSTVAPRLDGDARVGGTLAVVDPGAWDGAVDGYGYRWLRCDADGADCVPIPGAAGVAYAPTATDVGDRLVAEVVAHNQAGAAAARTAPSAPIAAADGGTGAPAPGGPGGDGPSGGDGPAGGDGPSGGDGGGAPAPGGGHGVGGLVNPVADQGGHAPNGDHASSRARVTLAIRRSGGRGEARRVRVRYGKGTTLVGRVVDEGGRPIAGARLNLVTRVGAGRWQARRTVRTDAQGRVAVKLPAGPNRTARLTYFPFADSRSFIASNAVQLTVTAPITIRADRRHLRGRRVVTLAGVAGGRPAPAGGVLVTLQGYQAGYGWRTFRTIRARRSGRWSTRYRFRSSSGRFGFRAIVPAQGGHPYATGRSRAVYVRVS